MYFFGKSLPTPPTSFTGEKKLAATAAWLAEPPSRRGFSAVGVLMESRAVVPTIKTLMLIFYWVDGFDADKILGVFSNNFEIICQRGRGDDAVAHRQRPPGFRDIISPRERGRSVKRKHRIIFKNFVQKNFQLRPPLAAWQCLNALRDFRNRHRGDGDLQLMLDNPVAHARVRFLAQQIGVQHISHLKRDGETSSRAGLTSPAKASR